MAKRRTTANKLLVATAGAATLNLAGCFFTSGNLVVLSCEADGLSGAECCDHLGVDDETCCLEEGARCEGDGGPDAGDADGGDAPDAGRVDAGRVDAGSDDAGDVDGGAPVDGGDGVDGGEPVDGGAPVDAGDAG